MSGIIRHKSDETGYTVTYRQLPNGTCYHLETSVIISELLEKLRKTRQKIRIYYGDQKTGQSWKDEFSVIGFVGRSTGIIKVPLLVEPGEIGGDAIMDNCIIRIDTPRKTLYQADNFHVGEITITKTKRKKLPWQLDIDGLLQARFKTKKEADKYSNFISGNRFSY